MELSFIITLVGLVWGILNLILFFKIWGACNDIELIANKIDGLSKGDYKTDKSEKKEDSSPKNELTEAKKINATDLRMRYGTF